MHGTPNLKAIQADFVTVDGHRPQREAGGLHALVRRARPRDLLPQGLARLLPHARLRTRDHRLHEHPRPQSVTGSRRPRQAEGGRPRSGSRHLAALPQCKSRPQRTHRPVHRHSMIPSSRKGSTRRDTYPPGIAARDGLALLVAAAPRRRTPGSARRSPSRTSCSSTASRFRPRRRTRPRRRSC